MAGARVATAIVKYLIVNGDDFGASRGINRAILELHELGVLTSTSLMIGKPAAMDAVMRAQNAPHLGIGLHVTLTAEDGEPLIDFDDTATCSEAIHAQIALFGNTLHRLPTHIDTHQNVHRDPRLEPVFREIANHYNLPLREHSAVRYFSSFYGQWDGVTHPEQIGIDNLLLMLEAELREDILELSCHPGYTGSDFTSSYDSEREIEVRTLADPRLRAFLRAKAVTLIQFADVPALMTEGRA